MFLREKLYLNTKLKEACGKKKTTKKESVIPSVNSKSNLKIKSACGNKKKK